MEVEGAAKITNSQPSGGPHSSYIAAQISRILEDETDTGTSAKCTISNP